VSENYGELWYFDAEFTNGYCLTSSIMIFGNISSDAVVQVRFLISPPNNDSLLIAQSYSIEDFQASQNECNITVGNNKISGVWPNYSLYLTNGTFIVDLAYVAKVEGWKLSFFKGYSWVIPVPRATVKGRIILEGETMDVEGEGYHDHILKDGSNEAIHCWFWGRTFDGEFTIVWAQVMAKGKIPLIGVVMLANGEKVVGSSMNLHIVPRGFIYDNSTEAYLPRSYGLTGRIPKPPFRSIQIQLRIVLDERGIMIAMKDNYFQSNCTLYRLHVQVNGTLWMGSLPTKIQSVGIMEYMQLHSISISE